MKPVFSKTISVGEKYGPAMEIKTQAEADEYFEACVEHAMSQGFTREEAEKIERSNLGYYSGYYSKEVFDRVQYLFKCSHPVFGNKYPTPKEAFELGQNFCR